MTFFRRKGCRLGLRALMKIVLMTGLLVSTVGLAQVQNNCSKDWSKKPITGFVPYIGGMYYPDIQSTYWYYSVKRAEDGSFPVLKLTHRFPYARYMSYHMNDDADGNAYSWILDRELNADPGHENPFKVGVDRTIENRSYTLWIVPEGNPLVDELKAAGRNVLVLQNNIRLPNLVIRVYVPDKKKDGSPHKRWDEHWWSGSVGLPTIEAFDPVDGQTSVACPELGPQKDDQETRPMPPEVTTPEIGSEIKAYRQGGGGLYPNKHNYYVVMLFDRETNGYVADISFKAPRTAKTLEGGGMFSESDEVRYWSLCMGGRDLTLTSEGVFDESVEPNDEGIVRVIIAPDTPQIKEIIQGLGKGVHHLRWGKHKTPVAIFRHMNPSEAFYSESTAAVAIPDVYTGEYAPKGWSCKVEDFLRDGGCFPQ